MSLDVNTNNHKGPKTSDKPNHIAAAIRLPEDELQRTQEMFQATPEASNGYPTKKVMASFLTAGTFYQLILFPVMFSLVSVDKRMGLVVLMFLPFYLLFGGLLFACSIALTGQWIIEKKRYKNKSWVLYTFLSGFIVTALFYIWFIRFNEGITVWFAISLAGGMSTTLVSLTALPEVKVEDTFT